MGRDSKRKAHLRKCGIKGAASTREKFARLRNGNDIKEAHDDTNAQHEDQALDDTETCDDTNIASDSLAEEVENDKRADFTSSVLISLEEHSEELGIDELPDNSQIQCTNTNNTDHTVGNKNVLHQIKCIEKALKEINSSRRHVYTKDSERALYRRKAVIRKWVAAAEDSHKISEFFRVQDKDSELNKAK